MDYIFLQNYWWFLVSLLGALLVFLLFVQGGNSLLFTLGRNDEERALLVNSTGRKWEFTFTTLVTFGGAFFASFPLFYSTSFGPLLFHQTAASYPCREHRVNRWHSRLCRTQKLRGILSAPRPLPAL